MEGASFERAIIVHDRPHVGINVARRPKFFGANHAFVLGVDGKKLDGNAGFERDVVETSLPGLDALASAFWSHGEIEIIGPCGRLTELVGERGVARSFDGNAADLAQKAAEWPEKPLFFHQETRFSTDRADVEFAQQEVFITGVGGYAQKALVACRNSYFCSPTEDTVEKEVAERLQHEGFLRRTVTVRHSILARRVGSACTRYKNTHNLSSHKIAFAKSLCPVELCRANQEETGARIMALPCPTHAFLPLLLEHLQGASLENHHRLSIFARTTISSCT